jgi:hypothetical protein
MDSLTAPLVPPYDSALLQGFLPRIGLRTYRPIEQATAAASLFTPAVQLSGAVLEARGLPTSSRCWPDSKGAVRPTSSTPSRCATPTTPINLCAASGNSMGGGRHRRRKAS